MKYSETPFFKDGAAPWIELANGAYMPQLGLGLHGLSAEELAVAFPAAYDAGYRLFDSAANYFNESAVGEALRRSGIDRSKIFITSKLRNRMHAYEDTLTDFNTSLKALGVDYLDLYLIHFPCPRDGQYLSAWRAMEHLYNEGYVRAIGVSNFVIPRLKILLDNCSIAPMVDQFECNPYITEEGLRRFCHENGIYPQAFFPLGGPRNPEGLEAPKEVLLEDAVIAELAKKYQKTPAQIILRWEIQANMAVVPKSKNPERLRENIGVFDFTLDALDFERINALNHDRRIGTDPDSVEPGTQDHIQ